MNQILPPLHQSHSAEEQLRPVNVHSKDAWLYRLTGAISLIAVVLSFALCGAILVGSLYALGIDDVRQFSGGVSLWQLLATNAIILLIALLFALPVGGAAGLFLLEYATPQTKSITTGLYRFLSGIPTVIYGFFAVAIVTPFLQTLFPAVERYNGIAAALVTGLLLTPLVCNKTISAIESVPPTLNEAAAALGMSTSTRLRHIILPAAKRQLAASLLFIIARIVGETMIVAVAAGQLKTSYALDPAGPMSTINAYIIHTFSHVEPGSRAFGQLFFAAFVLLIVSACFTFAGHSILGSHEEAR